MNTRKLHRVSHLWSWPEGKKLLLCWLLIAYAFDFGELAAQHLSRSEPFNTNAFPPVSALPSQSSLPDPLTMLDGRRITTRESWNTERRPELKALFQYYMYGFLPPAPKSISARLEREDRNAFGGKATLKEVTVTFGPAELLSIQLMVVIPNRRHVPAPVVLALNYFGNHTLVRDPKVRLSQNWMPERGEGVVNNHATDASRGTWVDIWRIEQIIDRGYAVATCYNGDVDPDRPDERGIQTYFRKLNPDFDCGTIAAWAWGLQRAVDYLVTDPELDRNRIIVTGHSRLGKAALLAAAFDERIAMAIPHQAGCGGSAPSRTSVQRAETVKQINDQFPHWFNARFKEFNNQPDRLPFDQNCLVALCAPRPVLFSNGRQDVWINPEGQFEVLRAASPVYEFLGASPFSATRLPPDGELIEGPLSFFLRPGAHSLKPEDWKAFLDFADRRLGPPEKARSAIQEGRAGLDKASAPKHETVVEVPRWEQHEFVVHAHVPVDNPFRDASLTAEFVSPSGRKFSVNGFYDGDDLWCARFVPDETGEWRYRLTGQKFEALPSGSIKCVPAAGHGFIRVHPENPYAFAYADGTPFFPMGDTCYGLYDDSHITPGLRSDYLRTRRDQSFNFVRMSVGHSELRARKETSFWAWGGTPDKPDLDRFNPSFFRGLDELFRELQRQKMNVELILLNFYRPPFTDTISWTMERERVWLKYLVARYASFNNLFLWTIANEYETHPDGRYRLDRPNDVNWVKSTARFTKECDPYHHLVTVHPVISSTTQGASPRDPFKPPWQIGGFFGEGSEIDVLSQQTGQSGQGVVWEPNLNCWFGDDPFLIASVRADRHFRKPVLNTESGYEYLAGYPNSRRQVHHTDKVRHSAWRIVCAGGYFAAGFSGTIGHGDVWERIDAPNCYPFKVIDSGAAGQLQLLYQFFSQLPFWKMQPFNEVTGDGVVALAETNKVYVAYLPRGSKATLDLHNENARMHAQWFNPRTGILSEPFPFEPKSHTDFIAPDTQDWALLLKR